MNTLWIICVIYINATTGDFVAERQSETPLTIAECNQALIARGPMPVVDGVAMFPVCRKLESKVKV